jgi:hypothetical protein
MRWPCCSAACSPVSHNIPAQSGRRLAGEALASALASSRFRRRRNMASAVSSLKGSGTLGALRRTHRDTSAPESAPHIRSSMGSLRHKSRRLRAGILLQRIKTALLADRNPAAISQNRNELLSTTSSAFSPTSAGRASRLMPL